MPATSRYPLLLAMIVLAAAAAIACSSKAKPSVKSVTLSASVTDKTLSSGDHQYTAGPATSTFKATDTINAVIEVGGTSSNPAVSVVFVAVAAGQVKNQDIDHVDKTLDSKHSQLYATLKPTSPFPVGTYRVDILINDHLEKSVEYRVQ